MSGALPPGMRLLTELDARFRNGLLWLTATAAGSVVVAFALAWLVLEAVTLPDQQAVAVVALLSGLALLAFGAAFLPLGVSLRLLTEGAMYRGPRRILLRARYAFPVPALRLAALAPGE